METSVRKLEGQVAFLTGAGAGIAKATAKLFVREGAKVVLAEISREAGERTEREIRQAGGEALFVETDVTQDAAVGRAVEAAVERFGRLDVLFNCAGGSAQDDHPVHAMDLGVWQRTVALNLLHPFLVCRYGLPHMMKARRGSIINISSHLGLTGSVKPAYAGCKGGLISFTKTLAAQYAQYGIRANAIGVGTVRTERQIARYETKSFLEQQGPAARERAALQKLYPFSRGEPEQVASIALFLACEDSHMLNGTTIAADGGRSSYLKISV
jgi:NAD(P)-dependent dehydrogenase (short-subunit alcohol dehydrogenase family)